MTKTDVLETLQELGYLQGSIEAGDVGVTLDPVELQAAVAAADKATKIVLGVMRGPGGESCCQLMHPLSPFPIDRKNLRWVPPERRPRWL